MKKAATALRRRLRGRQRQGHVSTFGAHAWDAGAAAAERRPVALKKAQPGTPEFRAALRDALEGVKNAAGARHLQHVATDHLGLDQRAAVMVRSWMAPG